MRKIVFLFAAAAIATASLAVTGAGEFGAANAKAHAKKGKPGQCGKFYYYDKKKRLCLNVRLKK